MLWLCHDVTQKSFQKKYTYASFIPPGYICFLRLQAYIANEIIDECPQKSGEKNLTGFSTSMVRGFGHEISVTQFIRVNARESLWVKATAFMDDPLFLKEILFLSLALDFKGYIQFLRRSSKSRSQWLLLTEERLQLSISLLF